MQNYTFAVQTPVMETIDASFLAFQKLIEDIKGYGTTIYTEQDARVKIIDRVLIEVLGYDYSDIFTEPHSGVGYIDYRINVKGLPRLIVEAKRDGVDFDIDSTYAGRAFNLDGPVFGNKEFKAGFGQTIYYAAQEGVELGCLTNGRTWVIFRANRMADGKKVTSGKGIVFSSLESIAKEFKLFYELLAPHPIGELKYRAIFQEVEGQEIRMKDFVQSLKTEDTIRLVDHDNYSSDFDRVMTTFFSKLSGDSDNDLLVNCFVETKESQAAEVQLARISEDLIAKVKNIETVEGEAIQAAIERIKVTNRQEFIILVGGKGAGKSTFVERFFTYVLSSNLKNDCILVRINLANYKGSDKDIIDWLDVNLLEECERTLYNGAPAYDDIQGMFYGEYTRLRVGSWRDTYNKDKTQFKIDFGKHIEALREKRPTEYIQKLIGHIVKSRKKIPCIIFDNADHFSIEIQEKVFQYARSIYENEVCLVIVPITDKTSWQLSKQGAIRSYENEVLFLPTPPPLKVIEKRIDYIDKKIEYEKKHKGTYFLNKGIRLELQNIEGFVRYLQLVFLKDRLVSKWIGSLSNYDIRTCLELTKDLISSPHLSIAEFIKAYVSTKGVFDDPRYSIKPYRVKNAIIKRQYSSYPVNHHPYVQNLFYCTGNVDTTPLLAIRILQLLMDRKADRGATDAFLLVDQILDYFSAMGVDRSITKKHLQFMLGKGLVSSYDPSIYDIDYSRSIEVTPSGEEHYYWSNNDIDYAYIMLEVTPITDKSLFVEFSSYYYSYYQKFNLTLQFLSYLEQEDKLYCKVPDHLSYQGQGVVFKLIERNKKILQRQIDKQGS